MPRRIKHGSEYRQIGQRISTLRKSRGWTQQELAQHAVLSPAYLAEVERGGRNPSIETILNIAAALNVGAGYLVDGSQLEVREDLQALAETWPVLDVRQRAAMVEVASLFVAGKAARSDRTQPGGKKRTKKSR
jgi:transcriptional regulator with XRE-family HTH domain